MFRQGLGWSHHAKGLPLALECSHLSILQPRTRSSMRARWLPTVSAFQKRLGPLTCQRTTKRLNHCQLCRAQRDESEEQTSKALSRDQLVIVAGGFALLFAAGITINREDIADAFYGDGISTGVSSWGGGDVLGGVLWSIALYFSSPWQLLLIFLGKVETERPSDWLLDVVSKAAGNDVTRPEYSHPLYLRAAAVLFFAVCGTLVAGGFSAALGDATWSVSTGLGSCFVAAIYEVGRPKRLSSEEAQQMEDQYADFEKFAEERLQPRGGCHETEIFTAFRKSDAKYRTEDLVSDTTLRQFIRNWAKRYIYPTAERTSSGYFKKISLRETVDPFTGNRSGVAGVASSSGK